MGEHGLRPELGAHLRSATRTKTSPTRASPCGLTPDPAASPRVDIGCSSTTTRCAWRPPGRAMASSTGTASTSTAATRFIRGSSGAVDCRDSADPAGRTRKPANSPTSGRRARRPPLRPASARLVRFRGLYHFGDQAVFRIPSATLPILESPGYETSSADDVVFTRTLEIGRSSHELLMRVADGDAHVAVVGSSQVQRISRDNETLIRIPAEATPLAFKVLLSAAAADAEAVKTSIAHRALIHGGPKRWPEMLTTQADRDHRRRTVRRRIARPSRAKSVDMPDAAHRLRFLRRTGRPFSAPGTATSGASRASTNPTASWPGGGSPRACSSRWD